MLGYEVDFGYMEFISLLSSSKCQEKAVGYMAVSLFLKSGDELMTLVINSIRNDIIGRLNFGQTLALSAVANIGGSDLAESLSGDVQKLLITSLVAPVSTLSVMPNPNHQDQLQEFLRLETDARNRGSVTKKAALCLLRLHRSNPECLSVDDWVVRLEELLQNHNLGIVTSSMSLLLELATVTENLETLAPLVPHVITVLKFLAVSRACPQGYVFYNVPSPWLQVKLLKFLQLYTLPEPGKDRDTLLECLEHILTRTESIDSAAAASNGQGLTDTVNKTNADYSVLCEAILLIIGYGDDVSESIRVPAFSFVGKFVSTDEPNIRYIGLDLMNFILKNEGPDGVRIYKDNVIESLKDSDNSVKKRALENIFSLADEENVRDIVDELLLILPGTDTGIKEDFVVKIAILTEKFYGGELVWYIDTMVRMILLAGDFVAEAIWHRIVLIITNHPEVHEYAAEKLLESVRAKFIPDLLIALSAYLLGEIGINICEKPEMSGYEQFVALHSHFHISSVKTQAILLTTYVKFVNLYPDTREAILEIFDKHATSLQLELQQRACEYIQMPSINAEVMEQVSRTSYSTIATADSHPY